MDFCLWSYCLESEMSFQSNNGLVHAFYLVSVPCI